MKTGQTYSQPSAPQWGLTLLNQLFEIEKKLSAGENSDPSKCLRNVCKIKDALEEQGLFYEDPIGQPYKETRTDLEVALSGTGTENLRVVEVIKPIIRYGKRDSSRICQKGIVVVESVTNKEEN